MTPAARAVHTMLLAVGVAAAVQAQAPASPSPPAPGLVKVVRLFGDARGETHLETIEVPLDPRGARSQVLHGPGTMQFARFAATMNADWHTTNRRLYLIVLSGAGYEIEVTDGTRMRFEAGSVLLADDMKSKGHRTRALGGESLVVFIDSDDLPGR